MSAYYIMFKTNCKLLLRSKAYLALVILVPLVSVFLLNIQTGAHEVEPNTVSDLTTDVTNITDFNIGSKMAIKVYDSAETEESKYYIDMLSQSGMYIIFRYPSESMTKEQITESAKETANRSSLQAMVYIPEDFLSDNTVTIFPVGVDDRITLLEQQLMQNMTIMKNYSDAQDRIDIGALQGQQMEHQIIEVNPDGLTIKQQIQQANISFSLVAITLSFAFTGVCITSIISYEKEHRIVTKILMIPGTVRRYIFVKASITLSTVVLQCFIMALYFLLFVNIDIGISIWQYIGLLFGVGLVFNLISVVIGLFVANVLTTSYLTFFIWAITSMLSGLYFPGMKMPDIWEKIALLMPQKWLVMTSEALMQNNHTMILVYIAVIIGFITVIMTFGILGIKVNERE